VAFTDQDKQKLLNDLRQKAGAYLISLSLLEVAMFLSSNEGLHAEINKLIENDKCQLIAKSFKDSVTQYTSIIDNPFTKMFISKLAEAQSEIEILKSLLQASSVEITEHHDAAIEVAGETVEHIL
jgi:hypothetical protein